MSALNPASLLYAFFLAWAFLLFPGRAVAQDQRALLEVVINGVQTGEAIVILRVNDALIGTAELDEAGLRGFEGRREMISGREMVSLSSLAPGVLFSVDETDLRLTLIANPDLLGTQVRDLSSGAPADLTYGRNTSGFVNYAVNYRSGNQVDVFTESAMSAKGILFYNTMSATRDSARRGVTSVSIDQRRQMRRWTFGDTLSYSGALGGDAWLAGVSVSREFAIDPYFVRHPTLTLSTPISVPSVMEVHVNGQLVRQEPIAPGHLDVRNLPLTLGRNDARIVVRDAFGGTRELSSTYYLTTTTLAPGLHDYQYSVGFRRQNEGTTSWTYGAPTAMARHRVGITSSLTLGGRAEVEAGRLFSAGPSLNARLPFGEVEAAVSMSRDEREWGAASLTSFTYSDRPVSAGGSVTIASRHHATLTEYPQGENPAVQTNLFVSTSLGGPASLTLQHTVNRLHEGISRSRAAIFSTVRLRQNLELSASVTRTRDERGPGHEIYGGLTVLFARASTALSLTRSAGGTQAALDLQQPLPAGVGYGFQMRAEGGDSDRFSGAARYQGPHGRYEIGQESNGEQMQTTLNVSGALVAIGGGVHATRPIQDSFALIRVPGVEGVRGFASNQEIGKTGRTGDLLIPNLQAYYGNTLNIADSDVPLDYSVPGVRLTLAPPYRGGAVALFGVHRVQRVVGKVRIADGNVAPGYGELTVTMGSGSQSSPIGGDGSFYFENLPAGRYPAVIQDRNGECRFDLVVPVSDAHVVKLGVTECVPGGQP